MHGGSSDPETGFHHDPQGQRVLHGVGDNMIYADTALPGSGRQFPLTCHNEEEDTRRSDSCQILTFFLLFLPPNYSFRGKSQKLYKYLTFLATSCL